jgi:hypothetical protein
MLPAAVVEPLRKHLQTVKRQHEQVSHEDWAVWRYPTPSIVNILMQPRNGDGNGCFLRQPLH